MPDWRQKPAKYNACISKYIKDGVSVSFVQPRGDLPFILVRSTWGPWHLVEVQPGDAPDLEAERKAYLCHYPSPRQSRGMNIWERLRRPEL